MFESYCPDKVWVEIQTDGQGDSSISTQNSFGGGIMKALSLTIRK